jgi:dipeptidyl aminopeptidase/acylaminoacyl peptidase
MTVETGLYRCAVAVAPVSDLRAMLADEERRSFSRGDDNDSIRYWKRFMGAEGSRDASLDERSPARLARLARGATGPILLIHGRDDTVVPFSQSTLMLEALGGEGPKAHLVAFEGQNHDLAGREERLRMLTETLRFLETHNPAN